MSSTFKNKGYILRLLRILGSIRFIICLYPVSGNKTKPYRTENNIINKQKQFFDRIKSCLKKNN